MTEERPTVLVVDDDADLADRYAEYLREGYDVDVAYSGAEAIETLSSAYDAVLLDRRMPDVSGNEVIAALERQDVECRVAMVTAADPDFDIIALQIDDYLVKPVTRQEVRDTVDRLLKLDQYTERARELSAKRVKRNVIELEKSPAELSDSEEFERLTRDIETLEEEVETIADDLDRSDLGRYS